MLAKLRRDAVSTDITILVATDLSARSDRPLERALLLKRQLGASLLVLHVLEGKNQLGAEDELKLRALLQGEFGLTTEDAEICFDNGSVPETIARVAAERGCALIVTGVARYNSPRDFVLGTAVDYLVRKSSLPVLIVKRRARQPYVRLVVATDFSDAATHALLAAAELFPHAKICLVHAFQAAFQGFLEHDTTALFIREEAEKSMRRLLSELPATIQRRVEAIVEEGQPACVFSSNVCEQRGDLLVFGTKAGRAGYAHVAGSEDAWHLPRTEPCDVLIVREAHVKGRILPRDTTSQGSGR